MGDYEKEQARLAALWSEIEAEDFIDAEDSEEENEEDNLQTVDDYENSEQEAESEVEEEEVEDYVITNKNKFYKGKNGTKWFKEVPNRNVRTRAENIITHLPGVKTYGKAAKSPIDCFMLFFDQLMLESIVECTNLRIAEKSEKWRLSPHYGATNISELKAVLGLLFLAGAFRNNHRRIADLWATDGTGMDVFRCTMSQRRFEFLISCLRFDNKATREERRKIDKLAPIRALFEKFVENCQSAYTPSEYVTIDEKLESFRGRCSFRQYIPNKPAKYGIKVQALVDARTYYVLNLEVYVGLQPEGPFRQSNSPKETVERLVAPISKTKRNVTFDNWYTSYELVTSLRENHNLTAVGTVRKNKAILPPEFIQTKNKSIHSSMFGFQERYTLLSYVPKKGKVVILLSSLHHDNNVVDTEKKLPEMISFYNFTKGGVDTVDEMSATYSVSRNSRRWPLTLFFSMLNSAGINAQIIYRMNNADSKKERRIFLKELGFQLAEGHQRERMTNQRIPRELRYTIRRILGENPEQPAKRLKMGVQGRCSVCPRTKDRKTKNICAVCGAYICLEHSVLSCHQCHEND